MSLMRIDDLFHFEKGILQSSKCTEGQFDFITASSEWKTHNEYTHDCEALVFAAAASGSLGRTHYVNGKFISSDLCFIITAKDPIKLPIDLKFYHMIFNEFKNDIVNSTKAGTSKEAIGMKAFGNYKLPYFDIDKQIVTKVQFVNMQHSKVELNVELTHQLNLIKQMRQAFLREAMQGRFEFPQQPLTEALEGNGFETGQQLLTKIKAEKAKLIADKKLKKDKELPPITEVEIPFEIPEHWTWCRLGEIGNSTIGIIFSPNQVGSIGIPVLRANNIQNNLINYSNLINVNIEVREKQIANMGDILLCVRSGSNNLIGKACLIDQEGLSFGAFMSLYRSVFNSFVFKFMSSDIFKTQINDKKSTGINQLTQGTLNNIIVPLPPLHEQEQIVAKLEELMAFCDGLEQSIKESQGYNEMLLQQVLREALQGEVKVSEL
jgi:type I restriction enzyme S subunit